MLRSYVSWKNILFAVCVVLLCLELFYLVSLPQFKDNLALATNFEDEPFTELYFEDSSTLPVHLTDSKLHSFQFTLHNLEGHQMSYSYEVYLVQNNGENLLNKGQVLLQQDQYRTINQNFKLTTFNSPSGIVVNIPNMNQKIDFWINRI